jgi:O-antigen ligase/tetratricopeptide (TPR) repeat protein
MINRKDSILTKNSSLNFKYLAQETVLILVIGYLLFFASSHNGLVAPIILAFSAGLFTVILLGLFISHGGMNSKVSLPVLVFMGALLLTSFTSIDPRRSLSEFWLLGISFFLFLTAVDLVRQGWLAELWIKTLLIIGALIMGLAWVEVLNWYQQWHAATGSWFPSISFRLSLPNFFSVLLNVLLMMAAARIFSSRAKFNRVILVLWCLSALILIYFTSSRGGWIGTAAGVITLCALLFSRFRSKLAQAWNLIKQRRFVLVGMLLVVMLLVGSSGYLVYRQAFHPTHNAIADSRGYLWSPAWQAFLRSPLVGEGQYTFISHYLREKSVPPSQMFVYSHNIYLDLLSGSGLLGLLTFGWLVWKLGCMLYRRFRQPGPYQPIAAGGLAALAAFCVHGMFDSVHHTIPTSAWLMALVMGAVVGDASFAENATVTRKPVKITWILGLLVVGLSWYNWWTSLPMQDGAEQANTGNWQTAAVSFAQAEQRDPALSVTYQQAGLAYSVLANRGDPDALQLAITGFERAAAMDPDWALNNANLGALYRAAGNLPAARSAFQKAVKSAPQAWVIQLNLGMTEEQLGMAQEARSAYNTALELMSPDAWEAYFWRSTPLRSEVIQSWMAGHPKSTSVSLTEMETNAAGSAFSRPYIDLASAYLVANRVDEAERQLSLSALAVDKGQDALDRAWLQAEIAAKKGKMEDALRLGEKVLQDYQSQGVYGPGTLGTSLYVQLMFRRPAMAMELVPQLEVIPLPDVWGNRMAQLSVWYREIGKKNQSDTLDNELKKLIPDLIQPAALISAPENVWMV